MKFTTTVSTFLSELSFVVGACEKNSSIPILQNVLIEAGETVTLAATNLDHRLTASFEADAIELGALAVNADKLERIVKALDQSGELQFSVEGGALHLRCGRGKWKLPGLAKDMFPAPQEPHGEALDLPAQLFSQAIAATQESTSKDESRYALAGVKLELEAGKVKLIGTDGHRLAFASFDAPTPAVKLETIIPKQACGLIKDLCADAEMMSFTHSENSLAFKVGERVLVTRTIVGAFPNYELVIPKWKPMAARVEADALTALIRRVLPTASLENKRHWLRLDLQAELLTASSRSEEGEASDGIAMLYDGEPLLIKFSAAYLQAALANFAGEEAVLGFKDATSQFTVTAANEDGPYRMFIIMPMRF